ncbi:hypothetical protein [Lutibacter maritimus]|uniref:DUF5017 domain-containing protein n=1 Tax=Lutibacter maritimus TaxID=593133 RepID=A0A1I6QAS4_9FLAO|nr:hypothetical protein [Lutibacter maritimus]SFS49502.1 hypothetical protein SAMN04488006_1697 [Lutibacter maritimus]
MKKFIYLIMGLGLLITGCNPMDDIHSDIDSQENPVVGDAIITLTDEDYDALDLSYGSFSSLDDAKNMLPDYLANLYPVWGKGSSVLVNYKLYLGNAFKVSSYSLKQADYTLSGSNLLGFKFDANPANYLGGIINSNISNPKEGDIAVAQYYQFTGDAYSITPMVSLEENFNYGATAGDLLTASAGAWASHSGTANQLQYTTSNLSMTNYPSSNVGGSIEISSAGSEDVNSALPATISTGTVYYSALVNLSSVGSGTYFMHFMDDSFGYAARVGAKDDGSGKISFGIGASSTPSDYSTTSYELNTTYLIVASYNTVNGTANLYVLDAAVTSEPATPVVSNVGNPGLTVQKIAVRQGGGGPSATIDGIRVANTWSAIMSNAVLPDVIIGDKEAKESVYTYSGGAWAVPSNVYVLTTDDYNSMGTASGQPGRYDNFDSSMGTDNYITKFLSIKYPYAKDGDELKVIYKYYSGGAQTRGNLYTVVDGQWTAYQSTQETSLQFAHDGVTWVPDNTIKYEFLKTDYDYIVATFENTDGYANAVGNLKSYGNISTFNWTVPQIDAAINAVLMHNYPGMEEGQKFSVTIYVYDGTSHNSTINYILQGGTYIRS